MGFKLPTFADLPSADPRPAGGLPSFPQTDPGAAGIALAGKGVQDAGGAALDIAADRQQKRDKMNESTATLDLFTRLSPLLTKIELETDTDKIAEHRAEINTLLQTSGQAIDNPDRQQAWKANHGKAILEANKDADKRTTLLYRNKSTAASNVLLDRVTAEGVVKDDAQAFQIALQGIDTNLEYQVANGNKLPEAAYEEGKRRRRALVEGRVLNLVNRDMTVEAQALLDTQGHLIDDPVQRGNFELRIKEKAEKIGDEAELNRRWGGSDKGYAVPRSSGGVSVGGAIPSRIADEAGRQNFDPKTALATAQIESSMGSNLGSRGNIFQLGKNEWSTIGGGSMGEPGTDIKNGVAWLGKTRSELTDRLGREPEGWEIYLGHQQGIGGATKLLGSPNTPAGQLVPPEHIRANGGDPNAPASAFVSKWRNKFNRAADGIGSISTAAPAGPADKPVAIGDSIAAHLIRKTDGAVAGVEYNNVYKDDSTAVSGASPAVVLGTINKTPEGNIKGRDILLSTGASNNPGQIDMVADQIKALKARGARSVTVLGVGTADRVRGANDQLSQIAADNGATFAGPMRKVAGDGIHSSDPKDLLTQAQAVRPTAGGRGPDRLEADQNDAPASGEPIPLDRPAPSAAPLRDISADIAQVQADADRGLLTQKRANYVIARLQERYNHTNAAQANDRAALGRKLANTEAALADGNDIEYSHSEIRHFYPKDQATEIIQKLEDATDAGRNRIAIRTSSPDDIAQMGQQLAAGLTDPNATDYAKRKRLLEKFTSDAQAHNERLVGPKADPVAYLDATSPVVQAKQALIDPAVPQTSRDYWSSLLDEQKRLGVPEAERRVLSTTQADATVEQIVTADPAKIDTGLWLAGQEKKFGEHWQTAYGDLVRAKLPAHVKVLAAIDSPSARVDFQQLLRTTSMKGGAEALAKAVPTASKKQIDEGVEGLLNEFHATVSDPKLYADVEGAVKSLAYFYVHSDPLNTNGKAALEKAYQGIIESKYDFSGRLRVPKGQAGIIESAGDIIKSRLSPSNFGAIQGNPNLTDADRLGIYAEAVPRGTWVMNEAADGAVLQLNLHDGAKNVKLMNGQRVEFKFSDAKEIVARNRLPSVGTDAGRLSEEVR